MQKYLFQKFPSCCFIHNFRVHNFLVILPHFMRFISCLPIYLFVSLRVVQVSYCIRLEK